MSLPTVSSGPWRSIPLREALGHLGGSVRDGYVLFGVEEELRDGNEPTVSLEITAGMTLGAGLRQIQAQLPPYETEVVSEHLLDLRPLGAKKDPNNILNLRVESFDVNSLPAGAVLNGPFQLIPALKERMRPKPAPGQRAIELYSGGHQAGPPVTLHLRDATVREILNATSIWTQTASAGERPLGWSYAFDPRPPEGRSAYSWRSVYSLPSDWRFRQGIPQSQESTGSQKRGALAKAPE